MKTIKSILILCVTLCFVTSCKKVDMTLVQKTVFENASITQIKASDAWSVTVVADTSTYVELDYSAYLEESLRVQMEGNELQIGFKDHTYPVIGSAYRATVHVARIEKIDADDAAKIQCDGEFTGSNLDIELSDAAQCNNLVFTGQTCDIKMEDASVFTGFQFDGSSCKAELADASQFNGVIKVIEQLDVELDDASRFVNKGGETALANIKVRDASRLNIVETLVNEMHVEITDGSEATVWVDGLLEGWVRDASTLYYKGHPQMQVDCSDGSFLRPI